MAEAREKARAEQVRGDERAEGNSMEVGKVKTFSGNKVTRGRCRWRSRLGRPSKGQSATWSVHDWWSFNKGQSYRSMEGLAACLFHRVYCMLQQSV